MTTTTTLDRNAIVRMRPQIEKALAAVAEAYGCKVSLGRATYDPGANVTFAVSFAVEGDGGVALTREARDFQLCARSYGLQPEHLGKSFTIGGDVYVIVGLSRRARKHPIICEMGGRKYKWAAEVVSAKMAG